MEEETILEYMRLQNRPYNVTDVFTNLHKKIPKSGIQKTLDSLVLSGSIIEKSYGKQKIYFYKQDDKTTACENDIKLLDETLKDLTDKYKELFAALQQKEAALNEVISRPSVQNLVEMKVLLCSKVSDLEKMKAELLANDSTKVDPGHLLKLKTSLEADRRTFSKRNGILKNMMDTILENFSGTKKDLIDKLGLEF